MKVKDKILYTFLRDDIWDYVRIRADFNFKCVSAVSIESESPGWLLYEAMDLCEKSILIAIYGDVFKYVDKIEEAANKNDARSVLKNVKSLRNSILHK